MSATKTKKTTARKAKTTKKATKAASIEANLEAIDGEEAKARAKSPRPRRSAPWTPRPRCWPRRASR